MEMLAPFAEMVTRLQTSSVSSSLVLFCLAIAFKGINQHVHSGMELMDNLTFSALDDFTILPAEEEDEDDPIPAKVEEFKQCLKDIMLIRFGRDKDCTVPIPHPSKPGGTWKIKTFNVFRNRTYTLAALLDPRVKTIPFQGTRLYKPARAGAYFCFYTIIFKTQLQIKKETH